jgi:hypothetical protein
MLRAYFDDSGTHAGSRVTVVAGLIGTPTQWQKFEAAWRAKLVAPLPDKPPLKVFHLSACNARDGEFAGYNDAEQDAVIHDFRQIIIDAGLISTAFAIDKCAWEELVTGALREVLGDAREPCVEQCIHECMRIAGAHPEGQLVAVVFDRGMWSERLQAKADPFTYPMFTPRITVVKTAQVADSMPLQGADTVATENYWHAIEWLKLGDAALPRPHLRHYLAHMLHEGFILGRDAIVAETRRRGPDGHPIGEEQRC